MRRLIPVLLLAIAAPLCHAAEQTQVRELPEFKSITSKGAFKLTVDVGPKQSVTLRGEDYALANVTAEVVGGELVLNAKDREGRKGYHSDDTVTVNITLPALKQFQMDGAGLTELNNVGGDRFELTYRGAGKLDVNGKVRYFVLRVLGVGLLDAKRLHAEQVEAVLQGVGATSVRASEVLNATVNGIGSLTYYGRPAKVNKTVGGIGSVTAGD